MGSRTKWRGASAIEGPIDGPRKSFDSPAARHPKRCFMADCRPTRPAVADPQLPFDPMRGLWEVANWNGHSRGVSAGELSTFTVTQPSSLQWFHNDRYRRSHRRIGP